MLPAPVSLRASTFRHVEHMTSATIKLFLPRGDAKSLRTAEISNWTGKAVAAPRTELEELLAREELDKSGVYILSAMGPFEGACKELIKDRMERAGMRWTEDMAEAIVQL